jgi:hypothetical protein
VSPSATPRPAAAPRVQLEPFPPAVAPADGLKIVARAEGEATVIRMTLRVDGDLQAQLEGAALRHNLNTLNLAAGRHQVVVEALDAAGNTGRAEAAFVLLAPTATLAAPTSAPPAATPTPVLPTATALPPTATAAPPTVVPVVAQWTEITLNVYAYEQALYTDPTKSGHPYPLLHREQVGPPRPRTFKAILLRNEYIELTLLPELGGRIYQCRYLPTGQELLYNNRAVKPTHWGPADQGWWLAVGGIEFCLPVDEHGYVSAEPWAAELARLADGSATVTLRLQERSRNLDVAVVVTLRPGKGGFGLRSTLTNPTAEAKSFQYWINAMLAPGAHSVQPTLRFYVPASEVIVHSRGDGALPDAHGVMSWPRYDNRDWASYATWRDWLGFFAPQLRAPYTAVYDDAAALGMVRAFPPEVARGVKMFAFGRGFGDSGAYTDDGSQYVEMWGGLTPTFWDNATLPPRGTVSWEERWYVLSRSGGPTMANQEGALSVARQGEGVEVSVAAVQAQQWTLRVTLGERTLAQQPIAVRPDAPFRTRVALPAGNSGVGAVQIMDQAGRAVLSQPF